MICDWLAMIMLPNFFEHQKGFFRVSKGEIGGSKGEIFPAISDSHS